MNDQELLKRLQSYVSSTEAAETSNATDLRHAPVFRMRIWLRQNGRALTLLIVSATALFIGATGLDVAALSPFAIGGLVCLALLMLGLVGLMLD